MPSLRAIIAWFALPKIRAAFSAIFPLLIGIFSSTFVVEITRPTGGLDWRKTWNSPSFYVLVALVLAIALYNRILFQYDTGIERFMDADYCKAYMLSQCLPEAAERYKSLIREGDLTQFAKAMKDVKRILS